LVIVSARLVAPEDDPLRLKYVVLDIEIEFVALTVKFVHGNYIDATGCKP
jgi:hypothetical protein